MADLLFLAPADLREAVLATGIYARAAEKAARVRVVCSPESAALYRSAPGVKSLHALPKGPAGWLQAWRGLQGLRFDYAVDLRGAPLLCAALGAKRIAPEAARGPRGSRIEQWSAAMGAESPSPARLWLDAAASAKVLHLIGAGPPLIALAPGAVDPRGAWPSERFAAVARRLATAAVPGARVALLGDANSRGQARAIVESLGADGVETHDLTGRLNMAEVGAAAASAALVLGGDGAFMHAAAAAGAPSLGLYALSDERVIGLSGARARTLRGRPFEEVLALAQSAPPRGSLLDDVSIDTVEAAALDLLRAGGL